MHGRIKQSGAPAEVFSAPADEETAAFVGGFLAGGSSCDPLPSASRCFFFLRPNTIRSNSSMRSFNCSMRTFWAAMVAFRSSFSFFSAS